MKEREAAREALALMSEETRGKGALLLDQTSALSWTVRIDTDSGHETVLCEYDGSSYRVVCSCGQSSCVHGAAVLGRICSAAGETHKQRAATTIPPEPEERVSFGDVGEAVKTLVRETCAHGLEPASPHRDDALGRVLTLLQDKDLPDLRRAVAMLRRELTRPMPEAERALTSLIDLLHLADDLRQKQGGKLGRTSGRPVPEGAQTREEMRLLEVARDTGRTPYGDRRDVSYFFDLEGGDFYREIATTKPGHAARMSEGPFPKLLMGNLVAIEPGAPPKRIRLLQYSAAGGVDADDIKQLHNGATREISELYESRKRAIEQEQWGGANIVAFAPHKTIASPRGLVLADRKGAVLPLSYGAAPAECETLLALAQKAKVELVFGPLMSSPAFWSILPLSALLRHGGQRSFRQLR